MLRCISQVARGGLSRGGMMRPALPLASDGSRFFSSGVESVNVTFIDADGEKETVKAEIGMNLLDVAHENDIEVEGACGGEMACSTCHMIFEKEAFAKFPEPEEEEEDMLDLALGLTDTSRLGCQVIVTKDMDGITVQLPKETASMLE